MMDKRHRDTIQALLNKELDELARIQESETPWAARVREAREAIQADAGTLEMKIITRQSELADLADELGVRFDWHEPDEQGLSARVEGSNFDNAGHWPTQDTAYPDHVELHVILSQAPECTGMCGVECLCDREPRDVAAINLATLLAWASERR